MLFTQTRIGKNGQPFTIYKFRSIPKGTTTPNVWGTLLRNSKLDELPQLINVFKGEMTLVGPRPDIPGYADQLKGDDRLILTLKPGITGLASLKYRKEEQFLKQQINPLQYNDENIWPDKVRINLWYTKHRTLFMDLQILFYTVVPIAFDVDRFMANYNK